jgi:hypothetical protein
MQAHEMRLALKAVAHVLGLGERSHPPDAPNHWQRLSVRDHVARAMVHLDRVLVNAAGDTDDLAHALTRLMLAVELRERQRESLRLLAASTEHRRAR